MTAKLKTGLVFLAGLVAGLAVYEGVLVFTGQTPVSIERHNQQLEELAMLREENRGLTDELFNPEAQAALEFNNEDLPYDGQADAATAVESARARAQSESKFLMVTFGANWCLDCRTLHRNLNSDVVANYTKDLFEFVNVDVGKFNQNRDVAESLGVSLTVGIPVAVFFGPDGKMIGTTNEGQLEPARHYSSKQILKFVRDVAERSRILAPNSVE